MRPIFVIGPPRSGTTLMLDLLAQHPSVSAHSGDFHRFHHDLMLFRDRQEREEHFRLTTADASPALAREYSEEIAAALAADGCSHFVLKISTLSIQVDYIRALLPDARFVQLVRDGRDAICSMEDLRRNLQEQQGHERILGPAPDPFGLWCAQRFENTQLRAAASWYYHVTRSWLDLAFAGHDAFLRLRYEDLIADPAAAVTRVLDFVGLEPPAEMQDVLSDVTDRPGPAGGLGFSASQAGGERRVGRFEEELSRHVRAAVAPLLEVPMGLLGYDADWLSQPERFAQGCDAIAVEVDSWRQRIDAEVAWFDRHRRAFAPERLLRQPDAVQSNSRPLLVDGAEVGCRQVLLDGGEVDAVGWVQKQDRRHSFPDSRQLWPSIAALLNGENTVEQLMNRFDLDSEATDLLARLHGLGFVAYV